MPWKPADPLDHSAHQESIEKLQEQRKHLVALRGTPGERYLRDRGIPIEIAELCYVKFSPAWGANEARQSHPSVVFPLCDQKGKLVAAAGRAIDCDAKITYGPKSQGAFTTPLAKSWQAVAIVEAPIDAMSLIYCGLPSLALAGTAGPNWLGQYVAFRTVLIATDSDDAGNKAAEALLGSIGGFCTCYRLRAPQKDWNECLMSSGIEALHRLVKDELHQKGIFLPTDLIDAKGE
jgi:hypothetical protein